MGLFRLLGKDENALNYGQKLGIEIIGKVKMIDFESIFINFYDGTVSKAKDGWQQGVEQRAIHRFSC